LLVRVTPSDSRSDPDLYISKTNSKPSSYADSDWGSSVSGEDVVSISQKNISTNNTFYVGVKCFRACNFNISAFFSDEILVKTNVYHTINMIAGDSKVLKYEVPKDDDLKSIEFIAWMNTTDHAVRMFVNTNGDGWSPTTSHFEGSASWKDAIVYHLSDTSTHLIPWGKEISILLTTNTTIVIDFNVWVLWTI